ncbi:hypothetical protein DFH27DRAFT_186591 [Peziza echinospora]|nr:hypothetical protein DFH27DRAFT_186591 [Peziza echinospora]
MGWYVKELSHRERIRRRELLDGAGYISLAAQTLVLVLLPAIRLFVRRLQQANGHHASPPTIGKVKWLLCYTPVLQRYPQMGTPGLWLGAALYTAWQFALALRGSNEDYLHLTKVFGTLAASNLPLHFLLAAKSQTRVHSWIFGNTAHDKLNILHRWLGRLIFTFISFHALLYLQYFWDFDKMTTRFLEFDVVCGVIGFIMMLIIYITSFSLVRHTRTWYFPVFYFTHIVLAISLFPTLWLHVEHIRLHLSLAGFIWLWDYTMRWFSTQWGLAEVSMPEQGSMLEVDIAVNGASTNLAAPGTHIFLTVPGLHRFRGGLRFNPFTIAATSEGGQTLKLVMRLGEGFTKSLLDHTTPTSTYVALENNEDTEEEKSQSIKTAVSFFAPSQSLLPDLLQYSRVLLIAGGVGGSFCVPWVKYLISQLSPEDGVGASEPGPTIRFIWSVKDARETDWALDPSSPSSPETLDGQTFDTALEIYITGEDMRSEGSQKSESTSIPLQNLSTTPQFRTRPNIPEIVNDELMACPEGGNLAVLVCGPPSMADSVRLATGKCIGKRSGVGIWFWEEGFGY